MRFFYTEQISDKKFKTPEGFLLCKDCVIARTGSQLYSKDEIPYEPDGNGLVSVERTPEEVFKPHAIASFAGKPFVIHHPTENGELIDVTPENWRDLACGSVLNPRRGTGILDDVLLADLLITDQSAINLILNNPNNELSCGYDADYLPLGPGKVKQINITGNHVAWVESGRCGPKCRIYDSNGSLLQEKTMTVVADKKFSWLDTIFGKVKQATSDSELAAIRDEALKMAEKEGMADESHTHIHLHPHPAGDTTMTTTQMPEPKPAPAAPAAVASPKGQVSDSDRISALEEGHKKIQDTLGMICNALGIGENGEYESGEESEDQDSGGFGDEANLLRETPHYAYPENQGIYEAGDYKEGNSIEMDKERPFAKPTEIKRGFGAEAPPGSSAAMYTGDKRRRVVGDARANVQALWQNMIADAEIIYPGIRIPVFDSKTHPVNAISTMCGFRRRVLDRVAQDFDKSIDLENITSGRSIRQMTCDSVSTVFRSLAAVYRDRNNNSVVNMGYNTVLTGGRSTPGISSIADFQKKLNEKADSIWGTGGATR